MLTESDVQRYADVIEICGVRYSEELFRTLSDKRFVGLKFEIIENNDGVVTLRKID